jgi:2-oxoglutarate dehydrogenase E2 component (dihydrolipoamide succinyltransferase)
MARVQMVMPKMGESIMEGTVIEWKKKIGDTVALDETILEIATDKVDSEVPSPTAGILVDILVKEGDTVEVGTVIAVLETEASAAAVPASPAPAPVPAPSAPAPAPVAPPAPVAAATAAPAPVPAPAEPMGDTPPQRNGADGRFYSPLVRSIAKEEGISQEELENIPGTGAEGRLTKNDLMAYVEQRKAKAAPAPVSTLSKPAAPAAPVTQSAPAAASGAINAGEIRVQWPAKNVEIIKMDRMRKLIAEHMVRSKHTSAHVTTFAEADVTKMVMYREQYKDAFAAKHGFKLTYTPFFIEATIQAIRDFPLINSSVEGDEIHLKREVNYGLAVALGESGAGGLIVPVIKNAGDMNLHGLARSVNDLSKKARTKTLAPDDLVGGTFTLTNYGSVGNLMGTPIINQPQVAIFGTGAIKKRPVVIESEMGDTIAIRHMCYLSMSYDHRIIDGALGGAFMQRVVELLENFDLNRPV